MVRVLSCLDAYVYFLVARPSITLLYFTSSYYNCSLFFLRDLPIYNWIYRQSNTKANCISRFRKWSTTRVPLLPKGHGVAHSGNASKSSSILVGPYVQACACVLHEYQNIVRRRPSPARQQYTDGISARSRPQERADDPEFDSKQALDLL